MPQLVKHLLIGLIAGVCISVWPVTLWLILKYGRNPTQLPFVTKLLLGGVGGGLLFLSYLLLSQILRLLE